MRSSSSRPTRSSTRVAAALLEIRIISVKSVSSFSSSSSLPCSICTKAVSSMAIFGKLAAYSITSPLTAAMRGFFSSLISTSAIANRSCPTAFCRPFFLISVSSCFCRAGSLLLRNSGYSFDDLAVADSVSTVRKVRTTMYRLYVLLFSKVLFPNSPWFSITSDSADDSCKYNNK